MWKTNPAQQTDATGIKSERCERATVDRIFRLLNTRTGRIYGLFLLLLFIICFVENTRPCSVSCESSMRHKQIQIFYVGIATSIVNDATPSSVYMCIDCAAAAHARTHTYTYSCVCVCMRHLALVKNGAHTSGEANASTLSLFNT